MDIYDSRYFTINKKFLITFGLWPYQNLKKKLFLRSLVFFTLVLVILPQMIRAKLHLKKDIDIVIEHVGICGFFASILLKLLTAIVHEKKMERLYVSIGKNFQIIRDKNERKVLLDYSEKGRSLTIFYIAYIIAALILFVSVPIAPLVLNNIESLNMSLERMFLLGGELFADRNEYYLEYFILDSICIIICTPLMCAFDSMYFVSVQHCLGLFAIIKFRLRYSTKIPSDQSLSKSENTKITYKYITDTVQLHKNVLMLSSITFIRAATSFTEILEATYSSSFLILVGLNVLVISFASILVLIKIDDLMNAFRFVFIFTGAVVHLFFLSWPGQALIDYSTSLSEDAYNNEWYETSVESQRSLNFVTLRCIKPCQLTAGGIYVLNFANFAGIMKTSLSYITMFTSLR